VAIPFFTDRLVAQGNSSQHTIASYRDTFRLLLEFAQRHLRQSPSLLAIEKLDAQFIGRFLNHLEDDRSNTPRSRSVDPRLALRYE
jgi:site-specific recombinase XerD